MKNNISRGIEKLSKHLDVEFGYTVANHNFEYGLPLENALKHEFAPYFPSRYKFGSGYFVDSSGNISNQSDWIIYDHTYFAPLLKKANPEDGVEYFPFDSVYAVVEVKRTLTKSTLETAIGQIAKSKKLQRSVSDPSFIHPLLSIQRALTVDVNDIVTNHFNSAIYAYSQDGSIPSNATDFIEYLYANFTYDDLPEIIAIHGQRIWTKGAAKEIQPGRNSFSFSMKESERNAMICKDTKEFTSGYFYAFLISLLQDTHLSAADYTKELHAMINDLGLCSVKRIV